MADIIQRRQTRAPAGQINGPRPPPWYQQLQIGYDLDTLPTKLTDADYDLWCSTHPIDGYCQERFTLQGRATAPNPLGVAASSTPPTPSARDIVAARVGVAPAQLTNDQAQEYCLANRNLGLDPVGAYCHEVLNQDQFDLARIRADVGTNEVPLTPSQLQQWCLAHPTDPYCVRNNMPIPSAPSAPTTLSTPPAPGQNSSSKTNTPMIVGAVGLAAFFGAAALLIATRKR